jgi:hypothetical protein
LAEFDDINAHAGAESFGGKMEASGIQTLIVFSLSAACLCLNACAKRQALQDSPANLEGAPSSFVPAAGATASGKTVPETKTVERIKKSPRTPGKQMELAPEVVWSKEGCDTKPLPFFRVDLDEVIPPVLRPGGTMTHRLVYAMCPATPGQVIQGPFRTNVYQSSQLVRSNTENNYMIHPGKWVVDTQITIPREEPPGVYVLENGFTAAGASFKSSIGFVLK